MTPTPPPRPRMTAQELDAQADKHQADGWASDTPFIEGLRDGAHALRVVAALKEFLEAEREHYTDKMTHNSGAHYAAVRRHLDRLDLELP
jgi:hypothetical protein